MAWRRELKSCYDNWHNTGARCFCFGVSLFLDREFKLQAQNLQHVISYQLQPFVLTADSAELKLRSRNASLLQTWHHGGAYRGRAPPNDCLCPPSKNCAPPPSEDCAPKKLTGLGLLECKSRPNWCFLWTAIRFHDVFGINTCFFLEITCFRPKKTLKFPILAGKSLAILVKPYYYYFFGEITGFRPEKLLQLPIAAGKSP